MRIAPGGSQCVATGWALGAALLFAAPASWGQAAAEVPAEPSEPPAGAPPAEPSLAGPPGYLPAGPESLDSHLPSSSRSKVDVGAPDGFDLRAPGADTPVLHGNPDALGALGPSAVAAPPPTPLYMVRQGDTLWDICGAQFGDPRLWPKVWSFNPQLKNPHWIYPGDQLRLGRDDEVEGATAVDVAGLTGDLTAEGAPLSGLRLGGRARVPPETVFLRDQGYLDEPSEGVWGQVVGSRFEQQLLSEGSTVYLKLKEGVQPSEGQLLTVFRELREPGPVAGARVPPGKIVAFQGTVRVDAYDQDTRIASGSLIESVDVIERGAKVGPIGRRLTVVAPQASEVDLRGRVLTSFYPYLLMGKEQVVFIDRGRNDGLKPGNRLYVVRQGDAWRDTLESTTEMARTRVVMETPERAQYEVVRFETEREQFPEDVIGELRVIRTHPYAALAIVSASAHEIEPGDQVVARRGY